jgi:hypothetical protein
MTIVFKLSAIVTILLFGCCSSVKQENIDYIIYGTYAGECYEHCSLMFKLEKEKLLLDTTDSFFKNALNKVTFGNYVLSDQEFSKLR